MAPMCRMVFLCGMIYHRPTEIIFIFADGILTYITMTKQIAHPKVNPYEQNRKTIRWCQQDYATSGTYFITICTKDRMCWFAEDTVNILVYSPQAYLADFMIYEIPFHYPMVSILNYVVMPDHIHILLKIDNDEADENAYERDIHSDLDMRDIRKREKIKDSVSTIIAGFKAQLTRQCRRMNIEMAWEPRFYDRVVRNREEEIAWHKYINGNPVKWEVEKNLILKDWPHKDGIFHP